mmetsp:Transcript_11821/g.15613  ORF Transcript_11821/g.15613 Transcript_11821/m.15613 type:complete len:394 (+) Transcript_11821:1-1182(+)|eukprot:CAMPEP_0195284122 /NCGR_PEP_ID=MMETSP0707-20130614/2437_1 /TAXON_ID=33640 /ORGANISM="Asterionellopsis glacialis, Strain CCMP134" /LENGTH=393 /DNA_ID=CAMNT_0040343423 /DNA_START=156 /DNA_END=1337 /DNA_ORIENTATION=-
MCQTNHSNRSGSSMQRACSTSSSANEKNVSIIHQGISHCLSSKHVRQETDHTSNENNINMGAPQKKQRLTKSAMIAMRKSVLRSLLTEHQGSTTHPDVQNAIMALSKLNPTSKPAFSYSKLAGEWFTISAPEFPNRIRNFQHKKNHEATKHFHKYTLGRLSFGVFEPKGLVCSIVSMRSPVEHLSSSRPFDQSIHNPVKESSDFPKNIQMTYPVIVDLIVHTPSGDDLHAIMHNEGYCFPQTDERVSVKFTGGTLSPHKSVISDPLKLDLWKKTFANAYSKAQAQKGFATKLGESLIYWMLKMTAPSDEDTELRGDHSFKYDIQRSPMGYIDILFLDDDMRITRGNKGSLVVVERTSSSTPKNTTSATETENDLSNVIKITDVDKTEYKYIIA